MKIPPREMDFALQLFHKKCLYASYKQVLLNNRSAKSISLAGGSTGLKILCAVRDLALLLAPGLKKHIFELFCSELVTKLP